MIRNLCAGFVVSVAVLSPVCVEARTWAEIRDSGELRICTAGSSASFYQANAEAFARYLGVQAKVSQLAEWDQQFHDNSGATVKDARYEARLLADGQCDLYPNDLHITDWRQTKMLLVPYYKTRKMIVANRELRNALKQESDLAGHRAAVQKGTAYEAWIRSQNESQFKNHPIPVELAPTDQSMKRVAEQLADFTVIGAEGAFKWVRGDLANLDMLFPVDDIVSVGWGLSARATDLRPRLEAFFADSFRVGSELDRSWQRLYGISLMEYHLFESSIDSGETKRKAMLMWAVPLLAGLCGMVVAMLFWTRRLKREVDSHRKTAIALRQSEANYKELVLNVNAIILRMNLDGTITYFNEYAEQFFGYRAEDILGRHVVGTIVPPRESGTGRDLATMIGDILATPQRFADNENENMTRDGRRVIVRWANQVIHDEKDRPTGILSIGTDITLQRQAALALHEAKEAAESANQAKSQFLATMSHEIRTPMNGVLGMAQMLLMDGLTDKERLEYSRTILSSGQTLLTLLNDILDLSKVEAGKLELMNSLFDPKQLLTETAALFADLAQSKGLTIDVAWNGSEGCHYKADPTRLRQMLSNLIGNAIKFTSMGFVRIEASEVERSMDRALLEFSVTDSGIGISPDQQAQLFQPFSQVDSSTTRQFDGTGLGLSIIRSLAKLMGGDVGVDSEAGKGAHFWFRIWADVQDEGEDCRHDELLAKVARDTGSTSELVGQILVVEDNPTNRKVIEVLLGKMGVQATSVENGLEAVEAIKQGLRPDLVFMDVQMPVMDGVTATRQIREWELKTQQPRLTIVALTAGAYEEDRQNCITAGMDDFLTKPIDVHELSAILIKWIGQTR